MAAAQKEWVDNNTGKIIDILKTLGFGEVMQATQEQDYKEATDIITADGKRIAARGRNSKDMFRYGNEFTIRSVQTGGGKTELEKVIKDGYGDYMFYYWQDKNNDIVAWRLLDLNEFRRIYKESKYILSPSKHINYDGSEFWAFYVTAVKDTLQIAEFGFNS